MKKIFLLLILFGTFVTAKTYAQFTADLAGYPLVTTGWNIGGSSATSAVVVDSTVQLTAPSTTQNGYVYYNTPVNLTGCGQFTVDFDYRVQATSIGAQIADGIAFWYISTPPSGFVSGGGIGLPSFANGLIMIMDTYDNISPDNVPLGVLLGYNGTIAGYTQGSTAGLLAPVAHGLTYITDGTWRHCKITYNVGTINVFFNYSATPTLTGFYPLTISGYFGFSSSTGAVVSTQSVKAIHISAVTSLAPPTVVSPVVYCENDVATPLTATGAVGSTFKWYTTDTGLTISLPTAPMPNTTVVGTKWYFVRQTSGTCISAPDSIEVIVNPRPAAPGISGQRTYCQNDVFVPFTTSGTSILWYPTSTGGTGSTTAGTVPTATPGTYDFFLTQTVSGCESPRATISVTVNPTSATPVLTAGNLTYCQFEPFVPFAVTGTNVKWYTLPTGGTATTSAPVINTNVAGVYDYYVTETDALGCESARLHLHVIVYAKPLIPGVVPIHYCEYSLAVPLSASGANLVWYGPGVTPPSATAPVPVTSFTHIDTFYVTQTVDGCVSDSAMLIATIDSTPETPLAFSNSPVCQGDTLFLTSSTATAGVSYSWQGPASFTDASQNPVVLNVQPTATGFYTLTVTLGTCTSSAIVAVNITPTPPLTISSNSPLCTGTLDTIFLQATSGPGAVYTWSGPYVFTSMAQNPFRTPVLAEYGGIYYVSVLLNGCTTIGSVNVLVNATPPGPWLKWLTYCQDYDAPPLQANGSNILWYPSSAGGTGSATPPVPATNVTGWKFYYASQTVAGCESEIDSIKVQVNPKPTVTAASDSAAICPRDSTKLVAVDADAVAYFHWMPSMYLSDTSSATTYSHAETDMNYSVVATNEYSCTDTAYVQVRVRSAAVINLTDSVTIYPGESYQIEPQSNGTTFRWTPSGGLNSPYISNPLATPSISTRYFVTLSTEWGCTAKDSIDIVVSNETLLAVPNAFAPGGANSKFKILKRGEAVLQHFRIYDRWGVVVFETKNIDEGWDGTYKGVPQPLGVYVYELNATSNTGTAFIKKGNLTLLR